MPTDRRQVVVVDVDRRGVVGLHGRPARRCSRGAGSGPRGWPVRDRRSTRTSMVPNTPAPSAGSLMVSFGCGTIARSRVAEPLCGRRCRGRPPGSPRRPVGDRADVVEHPVRRACRRCRSASSRRCRPGVEGHLVERGAADVRRHLHPRVGLRSTPPGVSSEIARCRVGPRDRLADL